MKAQNVLVCSKVKPSRPVRGSAWALLAMTALSLMAGEAKAGFLNISWSERAGHVRLEYQGSLDLTSMAGNSFVFNSLDEHNVRSVFSPIDDLPYTAIINLYDSTLPNVSRIRAYFSPFVSAPGTFFSHGIFSSTPTATSYGGNAFLLATASTAANANLRFADADIVNNVWTGAGFMQWDNTTLATLGIDASPKTWLLRNGDTITMGMAPVPEPSSLMLWGLGMAGLALWKRRR